MLVVEYGAEGWVHAVEIAPVNYWGYDPLRAPEVSSEIANAIVEELAPGLIHADAVREVNISSRYAGFVREVREVEGLSLSRDYVFGVDRTMLIAAGLSVAAFDVREAVANVTGRLGPAEYREFCAGEGLVVGVTYNSDRAIGQMHISAERPLLLHSDYATPISREQADALLESLMPDGVKLRTPHTGLFISGGYKREHVIYGDIFAWRAYNGSDMTGAGLSSGGGGLGFDGF